MLKETKPILNTFIAQNLKHEMKGVCVKCKACLGMCSMLFQYVDWLLLVKTQAKVLKKFNLTKEEGLKA